MDILSLKYKTQGNFDALFRFMHYLGLLLEMSKLAWSILAWFTQVKRTLVTRGAKFGLVRRRTIEVENHYLILRGVLLDRLKVFPFGLDAGGDNHFCPVHILYSQGATDTHAGVEGANKVLGAISGCSGTKEYLL